MMMSNGLNDLLQCPAAVSADGSFYSVSSLDGQLHIWDTATADMIAEYTPSAHLSATCVRLSWPPLSSTVINELPCSPNKRRKKLKTVDQPGSDVQAEVERLALVAVGTADGTVLLYSVTKNELYARLSSTDGHIATVTDVAWHTATDSIFTCSNDKYVIEWSISKSLVKSKHMLDRSVINSICVLDHKRIVTAASSIKLWNWETKELLKTFNGHSTEVRYIKPIIFGEQNDVLLSTASSDRYISAWDLKNSKKDNAIANFALDDEPISLEFSYSTVNNTVFILSISRTGFLYIFEHRFSNIDIETSALQLKSDDKKLMMNGINSPIMPKIKLQISSSTPSKGTKHKSAMQLPFLCAHLRSDTLSTSSLLTEKNGDKSNGDSNHRNEIAQDGDNSSRQIFITIGYGNINRPIFERISFAECETSFHTNDGIIVRNYSTSGKSIKPMIINEIGGKNTKIKSNYTTERTTVIGPAGIVPSQTLFNNIKSNNNGNSGDLKYGDDEEDNASELSAAENDEINNNYINDKSITNKNLNKTKEPIDDNQQTSKNKQKAKKQMTFGEQLAAISEKRAESKKQKRKHSKLSEQANTDSLVNVLIQGLKSNDKTMLQTVLECKDEEVVRNTIKKLPVSYVPYLVAELQRGLFRDGKHQSVYLKWIGLLMQIKISYLMTMNISNEFLSLNQLLTARTAVLDRCFQLKGRLDIMFSQIKSDKRTDRLTRMNPKLTYESDSSESENELVDDDDEDSEDAEGEEEQDDSMDDQDLLNSDSDDDDDDEIQDEEMDEQNESDEYEDEDDDDGGTEMRVTGRKCRS